MSDILALGAMKVAKDRGMAVPGDVSVVGFDDVPKPAAALPPLTTVPPGRSSKKAGAPRT